MVDLSNSFRLGTATDENEVASQANSKIHSSAIHLSLYFLIDLVIDDHTELVLLAHLIAVAEEIDQVTNSVKRASSNVNTVGYKLVSVRRSEAHSRVKLGLSGGCGLFFAPCRCGSLSGRCLCSSLFRCSLLFLLLSS